MQDPQGLLFQIVWGVLFIGISIDEKPGKAREAWEGQMKPGKAREARKAREWQGGQGRPENVRKAL